MTRSDPAKRHVWLPIFWVLAFLSGIALGAFFLWKLGPAFVEAPSAQLPGALLLPLFMMAPLLLEARLASRRGSGPLRVWMPHGRFEAEVGGTWLDVGWGGREKFVVWHTPTRDVKLAWSHSNQTAIRLAEEISRKLDIPFRISPEIHEAAKIEVNARRTAVFLMIGVIVFAVSVALLLQFYLMSRP